MAGSHASTATARRQSQSPEGSNRVPTKRPKMKKTLAALPPAPPRVSETLDLGDDDARSGSLAFDDDSDFADLDSMLKTAEVRTSAAARGGSGAGPSGGGGQERPKIRTTTREVSAEEAAVFEWRRTSRAKYVEQVDLTLANQRNTYRTLETCQETIGRVLSQFDKHQGEIRKSVLGISSFPDAPSIHMKCEEALQEERSARAQAEAARKQAEAAREQAVAERDAVTKASDEREKKHKKLIAHFKGRIQKFLGGTAAPSSHSPDHSG